ncbi:MAG: hypothetical protein P8181_02475 [bacterium]
MRIRPVTHIVIAAAVVCAWLFPSPVPAADPVSPEDIMRIKTATSAEISPDGNWIAYTVRVQREADDVPAPITRSSTYYPQKRGKAARS